MSSYNWRDSNGALHRAVIPKTDKVEYDQMDLTSYFFRCAGTLAFLILTQHTYVTKDLLNSFSVTKVLKMCICFSFNCYLPAGVC